MISMSKRLSRYTPALFCCALINLLVAEVLVTAGLTWPVRGLLSPTTLVAVHFVTLGWLTLLMFGALFQFVPVISGQILPSQRLVLAMLIVFEIGLVMMATGFVGGSVGLGSLLYVGGGLIGLAVIAGLVDLVPALFAVAGRNLAARCVLTGLMFLLVAITLGIAFALVLRMPSRVPSLLPFLNGGLATHLLAGVGGWFTLTTIGVTYKLLPMFLLAPEDRGALGNAVYVTTASGLALAVFSGIAHSLTGGPGWERIRTGGILLTGAGLILYLIDVVRMYRHRRRGKVEVHNQMSVFAFLALLGLLPAGLLWVSGIGRNSAAVLVVLALAGWLSSLALSQLYKIVAFLSWLAHYGHRLGRGPVPRVQDLVNERRAVPRFAVFFLGVLLLVPGAATASPWLFQSGGGLCLIGTLALVREYWGSWHLPDRDRHDTDRPVSDHPRRRIPKPTAV